ncbi:MAG: hypothetical protein CMF69_06635 [Magnetovibrio sp.]|nr:hypothetical protein [Magnetovibrio sp.]
MTQPNKNIPATGPSHCNSCRGNNLEHVFSNLNRPSPRFTDQPTKVLICRDCGLVSLDMRKLRADDLGTYYSTFNHFEQPGQLVEEHRPLREGQVQWILDRVSHNRVRGTALDIGCGAGYVLYLLNEAGYTVNGVDYSPAMIRHLQTLYQFEGFQGAFSQALVKNRTYDLITSFKVLEHLMDPSGAVSDMAACLNDEGYLVIEVPDSESPKPDQLPDFFAFDHLFHFTRTTLGAILERYGFSIIDSEQFDYDISSGTPGPAFRILAQKTGAASEMFIHHNEYSSQHERMQTYKRNHDSYVAGFQTKINAIARRVGNAPVAIYCGGEHTAELLTRLDLSGLDIACIFDGDPALSGRMIDGIPIRHRDEIPISNLTHFLLSTTNHEESIYRTLKQMDRSYRVFGLYQKFDE